MPIVSKKRTGILASDTSPAAWANGRQVEDLAQGWVDHFVHRLFHALNCQFIKLEAAMKKNDGSDEPRGNDDKAPGPNELAAMEMRARLRDTHARTLERFQRMLIRLLEEEAGRSLRRNSCSIKGRDDARNALIRKFNRLVGPDQQVPLLPQSDE